MILSASFLIHPSDGNGLGTPREKNERASSPDTSPSDPPSPGLSDDDQASYDGDGEEPPPLILDSLEESSLPKFPSPKGPSFTRG